jgi:hypothetical protein|nr:MAG TPA: hypothetical protein [Caudoviricetes sp.]
MSNISESISKFDSEDFLTSEQDDNLLTELKDINDGKDKAIEDVRKDIIKDENDISDMLSGLKQIDDNSSIGLTDDFNHEDNNNIDDMLGGLKQIEGDLI